MTIMPKVLTKQLFPIINHTEDGIVDNMAVD